MRKLPLFVALWLLLVHQTLLAQTKIPVLLDTDIGNYLDDAVALAMLLAHSDVDLKAVTTCGGDCEDRAWIACRLLTMAGRKDVPVAWGRDPQPKQEVQEMFQYRYHPAVLFNRTSKPVEQDAVELLSKKLKEGERRGTVLFAIAPLTNVARLLKKHPDCKDKLKQIVVMGGQLKPDKEAEWNFRQDVTAAQAVLSSGVPLTIVPFEAAQNATLSEKQRRQLFGSQTLLTQQLQALHEISGDANPGLFDAVAAAVLLDDSLGHREKRSLTVDDSGFLRTAAGQPNAEIVTQVDTARFEPVLLSIGKHGDATQPRELQNFTKTVPRGGLPTNVHAFEDFETDIERRWWLVGRLLTHDATQGERAMQSTLTLDFDDRQGDLKSMYSAVVFNPVPGPAMGANTRLAFRYKLRGTDQLRVQLYSLTNGYHRYLALRDLPQDEWQVATVDMTDMRRPDGTGGPLAEDERIDDIQFYVDPTAQVSIDEIVLFDAASESEQQPFPQRIVFTGGFDTGNQGKEWPGDFGIVNHERPRKWRAAKSVENKQIGHPWLRLSFRGQRPLGDTTSIRFKYRLQEADSFAVELRNSETAQSMAQRVSDAQPGKWQETTLTFSPAKGKSKSDQPLTTVDELRFVLPDDAVLLIDDVLVYEPGK